jgi:hypothetical protein
VTKKKYKYYMTHAQDETSVKHTGLDSSIFGGNVELVTVAPLTAEGSSNIRRATVSPLATEQSNNAARATVAPLASKHRQANQHDDEEEEFSEDKARTFPGQFSFASVSHILQVTNPFA